MENLGVDLIDQIRYVPNNITVAIWFVGFFGLFVLVFTLLFSFAIDDTDERCAFLMISVLTILFSILIISVISLTGQTTGQIRYAYKVSVSKETDTDALEENFDILEKDGFVWTIAPKR